MRFYHKVGLVLVVFVSPFILTSGVFAQTKSVKPSPTASPTGIVVTNGVDTEGILESTVSALEQEQLEQIKKQDITNPEESEEKSELLKLFGRRPISSLTFFNFIAYVYIIFFNSINSFNAPVSL